MVVLIVISTIIALFLIWGLVFDLKQRRRKQSSTGHNAWTAAKQTRIESEEKGTRWYF